MKKLMIAAAIVCAAAFAEAASVNWSGAVADPSDPSGDTEAVAGWKAYLLYSATEYTALATTLDSTGIGAKANNGGSVVATATITDGDVMSYAFQSDYNATKVDGFYQMLLVDEANKKFGAANQINFAVTGITDLTPPGTIEFIDAVDYSVFVGNTGWTGTIGAVPEPTSGLLLLLGVAGIALKRKRA